MSILKKIKREPVRKTENVSLKESRKLSDEDLDLVVGGAKAARGMKAIRK